MNGSIRLFRLLGITVFLHWSWFIVAVFMVQSRQGRYSSLAWNVAEYLALFAIVLTHEFGHALACRSVGGKAERIMLWPLGGVAFVSPPPRAGAYLWSIVAGPLVNFILLFPTFLLCSRLGIHPFTLHYHSPSNLYAFIESLTQINLVLLVFNLLPIYPLDGGQIVRGLLWFILGQAKSLMTAAVIGMVGTIGFGLLALYIGDYWLILMAAFGAWQCYIGFQQARAISRSEAQPQVQFYANLRCPACGAPPPVGPYWRCGQCGQPTDIFATAGLCPNCGTLSHMTSCLHCGRPSHLMAWYPPNTTPPISIPSQNVQN